MTPRTIHYPSLGESFSQVVHKVSIIGNPTVLAENFLELHSITEDLAQQLLKIRECLPDQPRIFLWSFIPVGFKLNETFQFLLI